MKIGEDAIPAAGFQRLPTSVRSILIDVFEHENSTIGEIADRTGFPQSHVSAAVARLREGGVLLVTSDPGDRRRTRVRTSPEIPRRAAEHASAHIDGALAAALGTEDHGQVAEAAAALELLARRLIPNGIPDTSSAPGEGRRDATRRRVDDFDAFYAGTPPWDIGRPQPALSHLAEAGLFRGRVLDAGCGTGEHALMAARLGLSATGIDTAPTAIGIAERKARERALDARFLVWDALELPALGEQFDTVVDCGLFHVSEDEDRARFMESLGAVVVPGGRYLMLCFSDRQPAGLSPRRVSQEEIRASFPSGWRVESIEPATIDITFGPQGVLAWLSIITRI